jgi:hypothetical protein
MIIFFCRVLDTFLLPGARHPFSRKKGEYGKYRGIARSCEPGREFSLKMRYTIVFGTQALYWSILRLLRKGE